MQQNAFGRIADLGHGSKTRTHILSIIYQSGLSRN